MDSGQWKRVDNLYQAVLEPAPPERAEFLRQACAGDEALEREVRSLLASQQDAGSFLESPAMEVAARAMALPVQPAIGSQLGPYRIEALLGSGGIVSSCGATASRLRQPTRS
jgi:eukaryotic-like serine/threonine-protein kinase